MNSYIGDAVRTAVGRLPIGRLQARLGWPLVVPLYHAAGESAPEHLKHLGCWRDARAFKVDLDFFLRHFTPVGLGDVVAARQGAGNEKAVALPRNAVHLTIDDGLREAAEVIAPLCWQKGIPATLLLTTCWLNNQSLGYRHFASLLVTRIEKMPAPRQAALWDDVGPVFRESGLSRDSLLQSILAVDYPRRVLLDAVTEKIDLDVGDYLKTARPYLDRSEVAALLAQGFTVGAHSVDHPHFAAISESEQSRQIMESVARIDEWFRPEQKIFAFPFGAYPTDSKLLGQLQSGAAIELFFGVDWRLPNSNKSPVVSRLPMDGASEQPARKIFADAYAKNIVSGWRTGKSAWVCQPRESSLTGIAERQS